MTSLPSLPSTALTHCQVYNMAAFLVVLYATSSQSTAECVAALQPVLQEAPLSDLVEIKVGYVLGSFPVFHNLIPYSFVYIVNVCLMSVDHTSGLLLGLEGLGNFPCPLIG